MSDTNGTTLDPQVLAVFSQMVDRMAMARAGLTHDGNRDLYEMLGYKRLLRIEDYLGRYERGGIAARLVNIFPEATWRRAPVLTDRGKPVETVQSPFEAAVEQLVERLGLWEECLRLDRLATLGHYAVLVLGLRGQTAWSTPASPVRGVEDLLYVASFSEEHAHIMDLVSNETSPLFGQPASYDIDFSRKLSEAGFFRQDMRPALANQYGGPIRVHASRVIHVAEGGLEDNIVGKPYLKDVWNYLDDHDKLVYGIAEITWQNAQRKFALLLDKDAQLSPADESKLTDEAMEMYYGIKNFMRLRGMTVTQLEGRVPDARGNVETLLDLIAGTKGIPKRKLLGTERGDLASSQDERTWNDAVLQRQTQYIIPCIVRPLVNRCIQLQVVPVPQQGYAVIWPDPGTQTEQEKADVGLTKARTVATYAGPMGSPQDVLPLAMFHEDILGYTKEEVERIMEELATAPTPLLEGPDDGMGPSTEPDDEAEDEAGAALQE